MGEVSESAAAPARRILVIEDEADLRDLLGYNLEQAGYSVQGVESGGAGLAALTSFSPHLVVLDLMLPDMAGTEVCRRIRMGAGRQPAVVMLTARGDEIDRVVGFEVGADDYVTKPFSVRELLLRIGTILRSRTVNDSDPPAGGVRKAPPRRKRLEVGPLAIDVDGYHVFVEGREVHLSAMEMRLLIYIVEHRGRVRSRNDLLEDVWGYRPGVSTRTVDTHVKRLRDKLGRASDLIETVRGTGYRLADGDKVVEVDLDDPAA